MSRLVAQPKIAKWRTLRLLMGVAAVVIAGYVAIRSFAAGMPVAFEPESGTLGGGAVVTVLSGQSGSGAVKFAAAGTPTPTPAASCALPAYPNASCTGVPAGITLSAYTGPDEVPANTVIDGKLITKCLGVSQPGVIIRNSRISCGQGGLDVWITDTNLANWAQITDSEIVCTGGGTGIGERGFIVRRVEVSGCENGFDFDQDGIIEDSYIHTLDEGPNGDGHGDGIQSALLINVTIRHNTIIGRSGDLASPGNNATSAIITPPNGARDALIENNFLAGGAYTLYCPENSPVNVRVLNNTFAHRPGPLGAAFGYTDGCGSGTMMSGNVTDTGQAVGAGS